MRLHNAKKKHKKRLADHQVIKHKVSFVCVCVFWYAACCHKREKKIKKKKTMTHKVGRNGSKYFKCACIC